MDGKSTELSVGTHRISVTVFGSGAPPVVIEPAFGGSAQSWRAIAETIGEQTTVVTYDRARYGASSRATDHRTPAEIAADLHGVLEASPSGGPSSWSVIRPAVSASARSLAVTPRKSPG